MESKKQTVQEDETFKNSSLSEKQIESPSPQNVSATTSDYPEFGWSAYAERINGRFAMVGFIAVLLVEFLSNESFLIWAGFLSK